MYRFTHLMDFNFHSMVRYVYKLRIASNCHSMVLISYYHYFCCSYTITAAITMTITTVNATALLLLLYDN